MICSLCSAGGSVGDAVPAGPSRGRDGVIARLVPPPDVSSVPLVPGHPGPVSVRVLLLLTHLTLLLLRRVLQGQSVLSVDLCVSVCVSLCSCSVQRIGLAGRSVDWLRLGAPNISSKPHFFGRGREEEVSPDGGLTLRCHVSVSRDDDHVM